MLIHEESTLIFRAILLVIQLCSLIVGSWILYRNSLDKKHGALVQPWPQELILFGCVVLVLWLPLSSFWNEISLFPNHVNEDLNSGLPYQASLLGFFFGDMGRPSYLYNGGLYVLEWIPNVGAYEFFVFNMVILVAFAYFLLRGMMFSSLPVVGVAVLGVGRLGYDEFEIFMSFRSWGTELLMLSIAVVLATPEYVKKSAFGLSGACFFLGLASLDNPFHLVHLVGFGLGLAAYFWAENRAGGEQRFLKRWQWQVLVCGVVSCIALVGPTVFAIGAEEQHDVIQWSSWLQSVGWSLMVPLYLITLVLAMFRPPREWYPLIGTATLSSLVILFLPLMMSHRTMVTPARYTRSSIPIVLVVGFGLIWLNLGRLGEFIRPVRLRKQLAVWGRPMVVIATMVYFVRNIDETREFIEVDKTWRVITLENGLRVFQRFSDVEPSHPPVYLSSPFVMTSWQSVVAPPMEDSIGISTVLWWKEPWRQEEFDCAKNEDAYFVGSNLTRDEQGLPSIGCGRCEPEELITLSLDDDEGYLWAWSKLLERTIRTDYWSPNFPYVVWRCKALK